MKKNVIPQYTGAPRLVIHRLELDVPSCVPVRAATWDYFLRVLNLTRGNYTLMAAITGWNLSTVRRRAKQLGAVRPERAHRFGRAPVGPPSTGATSEVPA